MRTITSNALYAINSENFGIVLTDRAKEILTGTVMTQHDVLDIISDLIDQAGTKRAIARSLGVSEAYFGDVLLGRRPMSVEFARKLGLEKVTVYVKR